VLCIFSEFILTNRREMCNNKYVVKMENE